MKLASHLLSALATLWPSPMKERSDRFGASPESDEYAHRYAEDQYLRKLRSGLGVAVGSPPWGKDVLEVGCGHGGISCYLACQGVRRTVGLDVNLKNLGYARSLAVRIRAETGRPLPVELLPMDAGRLAFADGSFDWVVADNTFEHFVDPEAILAEMRRVLRPGGLVIVPVFSSILSKYGLHMKHGLKLPWANLVFSEATIVEALRLQARRRPALYRIYPGLEGGANTAAGVRAHGDLNDITYGSFRAMAEGAGFRVRRLSVRATTAGRVLRKLFPPLGRTRLLDVLSTGASALLEAEGEGEGHRDTVSPVRNHG